MAFKSRDWWTERGWTATGDLCGICGSSFGVAYDPANGDPQLPLCHFHSNLSETGIAEFMFHKSADRRITRERWEGLFLNSWDRDTLIPLMSDEVLCDVTANALKNCRRISQPASVYDEALQLYAAELIKRLLPGRPPEKEEEPKP